MFVFRVSRTSRRWLSTATDHPPLCTLGWTGRDYRTASKFSVGNALLDGNYRTYWDFFGVAQREVLSAGLAFVKEGDVPKGVRIPLVSNGKVLLNYLYDSVKHSIELKDEMTTPLIQTIFHRKYDIICPLPSSKGPASDSNMRCAMMLSKAFGGGMNNGPPVEFAINRHSPLLTKSTQTSAEIRRNIDAPRIMHFSTMSVEKSLLSSIKGKKILLYDDVITWGNTSEAARNLLLILGASEVDVFCVFGTGPSLQQNVYEFEPGNDSLTAEELICSSNMSPKYFKLKENTDLKKHILCWEGQKNLKEWNEHFGRWIADFHPEYVPNDIPF